MTKQARQLMKGAITWWVGGVLAVLLIVVGVGGATAWAPDRSVVELQAKYAPPPSQFVSIDGMSVHVRDEGPRDDPQPIVLLHGTSASLHTWDGWVSALKGQRRVIRFDLPGFGLTGPSPDHCYTTQCYVRTIRAVYDHFGLQHSVLGGNSLGGALAWEAAVAMPGRVDKLILVDAAGYPMTAKSMPIGFRLAQIGWLKPVMSKLLPRGMVEASVRNVYGDPSKVTPELVDRYYDLTLREGNRAALSERFKQTVWGGDADQITHVHVPTLILWGEEDRLIPPEHAQEFKRDIQGSRLVMFKGLGHVPHEEDPVATVAAVKSFLGLN
ncbi:MAG TPA: alpha/beta hydrolase [Aquabacterium sp.]|nr:alpha/beta hydrolase [Aquabacterium sp.]